MIISRTPLRISFAGGGTDLPAFYEREPGCVVSTTIQKYIYITVNPKFDARIRASYSVTEIVDKVEELRHELIRETLKLLKINGNIEITSISDIPSSGTGLGSSSAYTVGLLNALYAHTGSYAGAERLAREACDVEMIRCAKPIGKQDAYIAAYGGLKFIQFNTDGSVFIDPIICKPDTKLRLQCHLLMLYTGTARGTDTLLLEQQANARSNAQQFASLRTMSVLARELRAALQADDLDTFGAILHEGWLHKKSLVNGISNPQIDSWYETARKHGALGGKILGAGGGGFLLLYAAPDRHEEIAKALPELRHVPIHLESQGSKIIYVEESNECCEV